MDGDRTKVFASSHLERFRDRFIHESELLAPVGLWELLWVVRSELYGNYTIEPGDAPEVRRIVMILVEKLLSSGDITVFGFDETGLFAPWALSMDESLVRINKEWDALGQEPDNGLHPVAFFVHRRPTYPFRICG